MRLFIIGATGSVGRHLIPQALARGHQVTAFVRSPQKITLRDPRLTVVPGDPKNSIQLRSAVSGHDAVIFSMGETTLRRTTVMQDGIKALVPAMKEAGVNRVIKVSSALLFRNVGILTPLYFVFRNIIFNVLRDHEAAEKVLSASGMRWTIIRPPRFVDGELSGRYRVLEGGNPVRGWLISRADLACALLDVAERALYVQKIVGVSR